MTLLRLFWSFFLVGLFSFGGGYAALPLIQEQVIEINSWLTPTEFMDILDDIANDAGTYCHKCFNLCRYQSRRNSGIDSCNCRLRDTLMHHRAHTCSALLQVQKVLAWSRG